MGPIWEDACDGVIPAQSSIASADADATAGDNSTATVHRGDRLTGQVHCMGVGADEIAEKNLEGLTGSILGSFLVS